ncbi:hypothetical protein MBLNU230_g3635t1 [Neophaeotheca triangularis]
MCAKASKNVVAIGTASASGTNGKTASSSKPATPDRATWPGWVELESDPAFFNIMLKEMGVQGVTISEVISLDEVMLAMLPQPVHALIFLFQYVEGEDDKASKSCPEDVWFANQISDSNCGTVAMLNIVNNVPGLTIGDELKRFKDATQSMSPYSRGDAIDNFTFVKRIHNSFASAKDMLEADVEIKNKAAKAKKKASAEKAKATRAKNAATKKAAQAPKTPPEASGQPSPPSSSAPPIQRTLPTTAPSPAESKPNNLGKRVRDAENGAETEEKAPKKPKQSIEAAEPHPLPSSPAASSNYSPPATAKPKAAAATPPRRSERKRKPRGGGSPAKDASDEDKDAEAKYHFIAYMPIGDRVWQLDGLDHHPMDMGAFAPGAWMETVAPMLQARMLQYAEGNIEFNCLAVVHDPLIRAREELLENIKGLLAVEGGLGEVVEDWKECEGTEEVDGTLAGPCPRHEISDKDLEAMEVPMGLATQLKEHADDLLGLLEMRQGLMKRQRGLRAEVRDLVVKREDEEKSAEIAREDYTEFVHEWLAALASNGQLTNVLEGT